MYLKKTTKYRTKEKWRQSSNKGINHKGKKGRNKKKSDERRCKGDRTEGHQEETEGMKAQIMDTSTERKDKKWIM